MRRRGPTIAYKVKRRSVVDGLGRLVKLFEDPDLMNYETDYSYTTLDQLTQVAQGGQTRSFYYDSLGRLTRAVNPETGEICYGTGRGTGAAANDCIGGYDGNGNLLAKQDGRGYATTMTYDALNRPLTKMYSTNASTPNVAWTWDTVRGDRTGSGEYGGDATAWICGAWRLAAAAVW